MKKYEYPHYWSYPSKGFLFLLQPITPIHDARGLSTFLDIAARYIEDYDLRMNLRTPDRELFIFLGEDPLVERLLREWVLYNTGFKWREYIATENASEGYSALLLLEHPWVEHAPSGVQDLGIGHFVILTPERYKQFLAEPTCDDTDDVPQSKEERLWNQFHHFAKEQLLHSWRLEYNAEGPKS